MDKPYAREHSEQMLITMTRCRDELAASWGAFTPLLHAIDDKKVPLHQYPFGSRGPPQADVLISKAGYVKNANYTWSKKKSAL